MKCRETTLALLHRLRKKNRVNQRMCENIANHSKNLLLKSFFRKLTRQKASFDLRIKKEIEKLEREVLLTGGKVQEVNSANPPEQTLLPVFRFEKDALLRECYQREKRSLKRYDKLLSKISTGRIREMLLNQKHEIKLVLKDIKCMGIKVYEESDDELAY